MGKSHRDMIGLGFDWNTLHGPKIINTINDQKNYLTRDYNSQDKMFIFHKGDYFLWPLGFDWPWWKSPQRLL